MSEKYIRPYAPRPGVWVFRHGEVKRFFHSREEVVLARDLHLAALNNGGESPILSARELKDFRAAKELAGDVPLEQIIREWISVFRRESNAPTISSALDQWRARSEKKNLSIYTLSTYGSVAKRVEQEFSGGRLEDLTESRLIAWYFSMPGSPRTRRSLITNTICFLNFCVENGWIEKAPKIRRHQLIREIASPVGVFSADEVETILQTVKRMSPEYFPNLALRAYAGLRTAEAAKMRWEFIDFSNKRISIPAEVCKTRDAWTLQAPNLPDKVFRGLSWCRERSGPIPVLKNGPWERFLEALPFRWHHNGLRHTFCTMHIALFGDATKTATLLKHRGVGMLYKHYCGQLPPQKEAERYFG